MTLMDDIRAREELLADLRLRLVASPDLDEASELEKRLRVAASNNLCPYQWQAIELATSPITHPLDAPARTTGGRNMTITSETLPGGALQRGRTSSPPAESLATTYYRCTRCLACGARTGPGGRSEPSWASTP